MASSNINAEVCIDAAGNVTILFYSDGSTTVTTTLSGYSFTATGVDLGPLFVGYDSTDITVTGTISADGSQVTLVFSGTADKGYGNEDVSGSFTVARNDSATCSF